MYTDAELEKLIEQGESDRVEFTESAKKLDKIREAICAFANDLPDHRDAGFVFIGIRDDGSCADLDIDDNLLQTLGGLRGNGKVLPSPTMAVNKRTLKGCDVAVIKVEPSDNPPVRVDGRCWTRIGPSRAQATAEEERRLTEKRRWGNLLYDIQGVGGASVESDLDMLKFQQEYLPAAISPEALEENERGRENQLQALRLTTQERLPTVTAILVLGKNPIQWFPGAYIQFVRYAGTEITDSIKNKKEIHGTLPDQLRELDSILKANIAVALDTDGELHVEKPDYPYEALRELARNAVIHRNYETTSTPVRIYWFSDRIEIISPGSVYGTVTKDNFGSPGATDYRNPTIAEAMKNMGFMQRFGMGIATARRALKENNNPPLSFDIQDTTILITVKSAQ